jgi:hypothetical protein
MDDATIIKRKESNGDLTPSPFLLVLGSKSRGHLESPSPI